VFAEQPDAQKGAKRRSIFRKTPAREAGTWWMPQFHKSVVVAVHSTPLMASAVHAVRLT